VKSSLAMVAEPTAPFQQIPGAGAQCTADGHYRGHESFLFGAAQLQGFDALEERLLHGLVVRRVRTQRRCIIVNLVFNSAKRPLNFI
jgi:hypothetical protein